VRGAWEGTDCFNFAEKTHVGLILSKLISLAFIWPRILADIFRGVGRNRNSGAEKRASERVRERSSFRPQGCRFIILFLSWTIRW